MLLTNACRDREGKQSMERIPSLFTLPICSSLPPPLPHGVPPPPPHVYPHPYLYESRMCGPSINDRPSHVGLVCFDMSVDSIEAGPSGGTGVLGILSEDNRMLNAVTAQGRSVQLCTEHVKTLYRKDTVQNVR